MKEYICDECGHQLEPVPNKENTYACRYCFASLIETQRRHGKVKVKSPFEKSPCKLPTFKGYTIDARLKQFRKVSHEQPSIEFIEFDSEKGRKLLGEIQLANHSK